CYEIRGLNSSIKPFCLHLSNEIPQAVLPSDAATDVEGRCFLRNFITSVDENTAQFSFLLLSGFVRKTKPVMNRPASFYFFRLPSFVRPTPLQFYVLVLQVFTVDPNPELWSD